MGKQKTCKLSTNIILQYIYGFSGPDLTLLVQNLVLMIIFMNHTAASPFTS